MFDDAAMSETRVSSVSLRAVEKKLTLDRLTRLDEIEMASGEPASIRAARPAVPLSTFAFLFSEMVQYHCGSIEKTSDLELRCVARARALRPCSTHCARGLPAISACPHSSSRRFAPS